MGPTTIGACDPALFTASSSTGAGGRPMRYEFRVTSEYDAGKILGRIRSLPANMSSSELALPRGRSRARRCVRDRRGGDELLGATSAATVTAIKSTAPAPIVAIEGPRIVRTTPGASLEFTALARLPSGSCLRHPSVASKIGTRITYAWTLVEGPSLDFGAGTLARTSETPRLYVEPRTLQFGSTYVFRVEAKLAAAQFHRASDTVTVKVGHDSIDDPARARPVVVALGRGAGAARAQSRSDAGGFGGERVPVVAPVGVLGFPGSRRRAGGGVPRRHRVAPVRRRRSPRRSGRRSHPWKQPTPDSSLPTRRRESRRFH